MTGFTAVISALGFMTRWLQNIQIIDQETGLAVRGMGISALVVVLIVLVAAALGVWIYLLRPSAEPKTPREALTGLSPVHTALYMIPVAVLALSGVVQLFQATSANWSEGELGVRRICALATLMAAAALALMANAASKPDKEKSGRAGAYMLLAFGAVWLIAVYKSAATDPVIWRFAIEVIGVCVALLAIFYVSGYFFNVPKAKLSVFFCDFGAFLCIMTCIDEHTAGEAMCLAGVALALLLWGFTITANLRPVSGKTKEDLARELTEAWQAREDRRAKEEEEAEEPAHTDAVGFDPNDLTDGPEK